MIEENADDSSSRPKSNSLGAKTPLMEAKSRQVQKRCIWKNVTALVCGVGIFTMGLNPIDDLQSSLNGREGLGVASLGIKYGFMILGNLFTNTLIIRKLGCKRALVWGTMLYGLYIVANFYPTWSTMVPLTVLAGLGGALMWTTQSHYLAILAENLAQLQAIETDKVKTLIFGIRGMAIRTFAIVGGLSSALILSTGHVSPKIATRGSSPLCQPDFCGVEALDYLSAALGTHLILTPNMTHHHRAHHHQHRKSFAGVTSQASATSMTAVYVLCAFCTISALLAVLLMIVCVHPLTKRDTHDSPCSLLFATVRLWKRKEQLFLIPITIVCGFQEAFWRVDFNRADITCALGIEQIVCLLACYNTAALVGSLLCGAWLGSHRVRTIAFPVMAAVDMASLAAMFLWKSTSSETTSRPTVITYMLTMIVGATYGAITSLLPAFYGIVFPNDLEAAYSNLFFWCFLGSTLMYALSYSLCLRIKLMVVLIMIAVGLVGYVAVELIIMSKPEVTSEIQLIDYRHSIDSASVPDQVPKSESDNNAHASKSNMKR